MTAAPLLSVRGLTVRFDKPDGHVAEVVGGIDLDVQAGEILGLVGESGSGKTMIGLSLINLIPPPGKRKADHITLAGADISQLRSRQLEALRGGDIAMVFQDPMTSFNPVRTIGAQLMEVILRHGRVSRAAARQKAIAALADVGVPAPDERIDAYPHELSGGLRQRAMIAMAMVNDPKLLIADEPTTALDATIQAQILRLLKTRLGDRAMILVTHDLGVAAEICDRLIVMQQGQFIAEGPTQQVLSTPQHAYTRALIKAVPSLSRPYVVQRSAAPTTGAEPVLKATSVEVTFDTPSGPLQAVRGCDIAVSRGETVGLVGESGSGKSTLVSALIGIHKPKSGEITLAGAALSAASGADLKALRRRIQMVYQDPYSSLNPRWSVHDLIAEPLRAYKAGAPADITETVRQLIAQVGLPEDAIRRRAAQFSGGQRQRIAIARALALEPEILIADEPVSALDVSMQAKIMTLLNDLQRKRGLGILIIAHDLALMHHVTDRIVVLYLGQVVETGPTHAVTTAPAHPYTAALLSCAPDPAGKGDMIALKGEQPSPLAPPRGCAFHPRCPACQPRCKEEAPALRPLEGRHVACHFPGTLQRHASLN
ncbi:MAG: ABC transporter ATP-binding protein [Pseudomonadota bacterium]